MNERPTAECTDKEIFLFASRLGDAEEQLQFLAEVCADDEERRMRIVRLLDNINASDQGILEAIVEQIAPVTTSANSFFELLDRNDPGYALLGSWVPQSLVGTSIGPYFLEEFLGSGGMGAVYRATQSEPITRTVALKIIRLDSVNSKSIAAFNHERKTLERIAHPGIVQVLDAGTTVDHVPYFVMEFVHGISITAFCEQRKCRLAERVGLLIKICEAVHHAHQRGVIHQDLKPENILVAEQGSEFVVKIIDFGISRFADGDRNASREKKAEKSRFLGTIMYMSPEQTYADPDLIDTRTDIYSLGVVAYELLCQSHPRKAILRQGMDRQSQLEIIRNHVPLRPSRRVDPGNLSLRNSLTRDLDWVVLRALALSPEDRYESADALVDDLQRFLDGFPVDAHSPSLIYQASKFITRHRVAITALGTVFVALVVALFVSLAQTSLAKKAAEESRKLLFVADMKIASDAFQDGRISVAKDRLTRHRQWQEESRSQNFAWRYLWQELNPTTRIFNVGGELLSSETSADGTYLFSGDNAGFVHCWDLKQDRYMGKFGPLKDVIRAIAVSPNARVLAAGSDAGDIVIWRIPDFQVINVLQDDPNGVNDIEWVNDAVFVSAAGNRVTRWQISDIFDVSDISALPTKSQSEVGSDASKPSGLSKPGEPQSEGEAIRSTVFLRFPQKVLDMAIEPAGTMIATASQSDNVAESGWVSLWDLESGQLLSRKSLYSTAISVAISPDGQKVASGCTNGTICMFDVKSLSEPLQVSTEHTGNVYELSFTPDSQSLVSASKDCTVRLWDTESGKSKQVFQGHERRVYGISYSPLSDMFYSCSADGTVREISFKDSPFEDRTPKEARRELPTFDPDIPLHLEFFIPIKHTWDPLGRRVLLSHRCSQLRSHDLQANTVGKFPYYSVDEVQALGTDKLVLASLDPIYFLDNFGRFSPFQSISQDADVDGDGGLDSIRIFDERTLVTSASEGLGISPRLFQRERPANEHVHVLAVPAVGQGCLDFIVFHGGNTAIFCSIGVDGEYRQQLITQLSSMNCLWRCIEAPGTTPKIITFDELTTEVAVHELAFDAGLSPIQAPTKTAVNLTNIIDLTAVPDEDTGVIKLVYLVSKDGTLFVLEKDVDPAYKVVQTLNALEAPKSCALKIVPTDGGDGRALLVGDLGQVTQFNLDHNGRIIEPGVVVRDGCEYFDGERRLMSNVVIVDRASHEVVGHFNSLDELRTVATSPDGKWIATVGSTRKIHLWDAGGRWCGVFNGDVYNSIQLVFSGDSRQLYATDGDAIKVFDVEALELVDTMSGHENTVQAIAISPTGKYLASASHDSTVRLWETETGRLSKILLGHTRRPMSVAFHPNEDLLASGDESGAILFWDVATGGELLRLNTNAGVVRKLFFETPDRLIQITDDGKKYPYDSYAVGVWSVESENE